jgi:L-malate glycosyltransferase
MHIVILPSHFNTPEHPNSGIFFRYQAEALSQVHSKVSVIYVEQRSLKSLSLKRVWKENHFQISDTTINNVKVFKSHGWNPLMQFGTLGGKIWTELTVKLIKAYIKEYGKPDIIHAHNGMWAGYAASKIKEKFNIPFVLTEHSSAVLIDVLSSKQLKLLKKSYFDADKIIAVGSPLSKKIKTLIEREIVVVPNLVDTSLFNIKMTDFNHHSEEKKFTWISIGNLVYNKGFETLIKAFNLAFKNNPSVYLNIIGDGELKSNLEKIVSNNNLDKQVKFLGRLSQTEVRDELSMADAFVLASQFETFGIVFIEAMAMGLPVVSTKCGAPEDLINDNTGLLVEVGNIEELSQALQQMYMSKKKYSAIDIRNGIVSSYDSKIIVEKITLIYHKVVEGNAYEKEY